MRIENRDGEFLLDLEVSFKPDTTSTFSDNISLPVHRWFRYSAGFSAEWAKTLIQQEKINGRSRVLDPFAGSGTVLLAAEQCGMAAQGIDAHPFIVRVAKTKLHWRESPAEFSKFAINVLKEARKHAVDPSNYAPLITKCYLPESLQELDALKVNLQRYADGSPVAELTWLALASVLRECSFVGTAQWQYVLPNKRKARSITPFNAFEQKVRLMSADMTRWQQTVDSERSVLHRGDSRTCRPVPDGWADLVITSPPYANNYDYGDATRLEMSFFGEIQGWGDLQQSVRRYLVRSCTQHVAATRAKTDELASAPVLQPIRDELLAVCAGLLREKQLHGGKKPYDAMIAAYFADLAETWQALRRVTAAGALVCFVVGDSAPYGIYVPVDRWLGELALSVGFASFRFEKTRDRNTKWKNRKHTVPLPEGRLWGQG